MIAQSELDAIAKYITEAVRANPILSAAPYHGRVYAGKPNQKAGQDENSTEEPKMVFPCVVFHLQTPNESLLGMGPEIIAEQSIYFVKVITNEGGYTRIASGAKALETALHYNQSIAVDSFYVSSWKVGSNEYIEDAVNSHRQYWHRGIFVEFEVIPLPE